MSPMIFVRFHGAPHDAVMVVPMTFQGRLLLAGYTRIYDRNQSLVAFLLRLLEYTMIAKNFEVTSPISVAV